MDRISLENTVFEGQNNAYLYTDPSTVLIDTGVAVEDTRQQLRAGLADHGVGFADVDAIVLTHYHADHTGLAGEIQAESDATVYAHEADAELIAGDQAAWSALEDLQHRRLDHWGVPTDAREELLAFLEAGSQAGIYGEPVEVTTFDGGDVLSFGDTTGTALELEVLHAPGHTAGLSCFVPAGSNEVFTGDALLPEYTPNVGGADERLDRALGHYVRTLETIAIHEFDRAWPGHRDPIADPSARAREILEHHESRAYRVLETLDAHGPADAWTVSAHLFGDLENIHILHGPGEAYAHLEHLTQTGALEVTGTEYELTTAGARRLSERDDGRILLAAE